MISATIIREQRAAVAKETKAETRRARGRSPWGDFLCGLGAFAAHPLGHTARDTNSVIGMRDGLVQADCTGSVSQHRERIKPLLSGTETKWTIDQSHQRPGVVSGLYLSNFFFHSRISLQRGHTLPIGSASCFARSESFATPYLLPPPSSASRKLLYTEERYTRGYLYALGDKGDGVLVRLRFLLCVAFSQRHASRGLLGVNSRFILQVCHLWSMVVHT
jgi:hypothetical protein